MPLTGRARGAGLRAAMSGVTDAVGAVGATVLPTVVARWSWRSSARSTSSRTRSSAARCVADSVELADAVGTGVGFGALAAAVLPALRLALHPRLAALAHQLATIGIETSASNP